MSTIGSFVFRDEGDGCLVSKYFNEKLPSPLTECCKLINELEGQEGPFCGSYNTTWLEVNGKPGGTRLNITKKNGSIYSLQWFDKNNPTFKGEGMLFESLLVGYYHSIPKTINTL